jgi:acyloxyacyl hydrolase
MTLKFLDTERLANGSKVVLVGFVDGRVIYESLHSQQHPLGVTYGALYDYLNCMDCNPCPGWLNTNETVRNATFGGAAQLNEKLQAVVNDGYKNFDVHYVSLDLRKIVGDYVAAGGIARDAFETFDGFHPSQTGLSLISTHVWNTLEKERPDFLGRINPHNSKIQELFGDQGGY